MQHQLSPNRSATLIVGRVSACVGWAILAWQWYGTPGEVFHDPVGNEVFFNWVELFGANLMVATWFFFPEIRLRYREDPNADVQSFYEFGRRGGLLRRQIIADPEDKIPFATVVEEPVTLASMPGLKRISSTRFLSAWTSAFPARGTFDVQLLFSFLTLGFLATVFRLNSGPRYDPEGIELAVPLAPVVFGFATLLTMLRLQTMRPTLGLRLLSFALSIALALSVLLVYAAFAFAGI